MLEFLLKSFFSIGVQVIFILWLFLWRFKYRINWLVLVLMSISYSLYHYLSGDWIHHSLYLEYLIPSLLIIAAIVSFLRMKTTSFMQRKLTFSLIMVTLGIFFIVYMDYNTILALKSYEYNEKPINLSFPLKNGVFTIDQGGNGEKYPGMNYHFNNKSLSSLGINKAMKYATDIVKVNAAGRETFGFFPEENEKYEIFNTTVYSPCDGKIVKIDDYYENNKAYSENLPFAFGNMVVIKSDDVFVLITHFQKGSIKVRVGDSVESGQEIGSVGNSGWSSRPHLHIQASRIDAIYGDPVPMLFDNSFPVKNSVFIR